MNTRKLWYIVVIAVLVVAASAVPAKADTLVYDNGPINGTINAWTINFGYSVSDSFTVGAGINNLTSATIGIWAFPGDQLSTVDWSIGTSFFGSDVSAGTGTATNTFLYTNGYGYDIYSSSFAISGAVAPGTYYLTLQNATVANGDPIYWDENDGPSSAMESAVGSIGSESFSINGTGNVQQTPEPASLLLLGSGLLGLAGGIRKRMKA
jgi:PEP-CTERM motif-containing protein